MKDQTEEALSKRMVAQAKKVKKAALGEDSSFEELLGEIVLLLAYKIVNVDLQKEDTNGN